MSTQPSSPSLLDSPVDSPELVDAPQITETESNSAPTILQPISTNEIEIIDVENVPSTSVTTAIPRTESNFSVFSTVSNTNSQSGLDIGLPSTSNASIQQTDCNFSAVSSVIDEDSRVSKSEEPPAKIRKLSPKKQLSDEQDGETCPICLDVWGNSGDHRLVALKCGHLFGANCVERWLRAQSVKERSCPSCKSRAMVKDMRFIYARKLIAADTTEMTNMQKQIERLQTEKNRTELELQKVKIAHSACRQELEIIRNSLRNRPDRVLRKDWRFCLEKRLDVCKDGGCRVLAYNCRTYDLYASQKSVNNLFPGFGIRKMSCIDLKLGQFLSLHPKAIRDLSYSQPKDLLLSASLDCSAKLVERNNAVTTIQTGSPLWSCTWDYLNPEQIYLGTSSGAILQYDIRNTSSVIKKLTIPTHPTPIVSLCSSEYGLLSCQLNSCWLWSPDNQRNLVPISLPINGPFMSMTYDSETHKVLISCRPKDNERSKLIVAKLKPCASGDVFCETENSFSGSSRSSILSRSAWVKAHGSVWAASHSESDEALILHGVDSCRTLSLLASEPTVDVCSVVINGETILAALSDSKMRIYKAVATN